VVCHIRPALMEPTAATLGTSLVQSRLEYANSIIIMYGMSGSNMHKLQSVQNSRTYVALPSLCHLSPTERLSYLHWRPVNYWIQFKIATLTYMTLGTCQLFCLYNLLQPPSIPVITSCPLFKPATSLITIHINWFRSAFLQLHGIAYLPPISGQF